MISWRFILPLVCLLATGCRSNGGQELLERELRLLEDEIFDLEDHLDHNESMLASCRRENAALRKQMASAEGSEQPGFGGGSAPPRIDLGSPDATQSENPPRDSNSEAPPFNPSSEHEKNPPDKPDDQPPSEPDEAPPFAPRADATIPRQRSDHAVSYAGESSQNSADDEPEEESPIDDYMVDRITLNRLLTGGVNQDDHPGDEGVMVVVEPRNAENQIINVPGQLAVVVVDPAIREGDPRVARWDFTADETAAHYRKSLLAEGIHLELPWPSVEPQHDRLHLHVRFITAEGKEFRADRPIDVQRSVHAPAWQAAPENVEPRDEEASDPAASESLELPPEEKTGQGHTDGPHEARDPPTARLDQPRERSTKSGPPSPVERPVASGPDSASRRRSSPLRPTAIQREPDSQPRPPATARRHRRPRWAPHR